MVVLADALLEVLALGPLLVASAAAEALAFAAVTDEVGRVLLGAAEVAALQIVTARGADALVDGDRRGLAVRVGLRRGRLVDAQADAEVEGLELVGVALEEDLAGRLAALEDRRSVAAGPGGVGVGVGVGGRRPRGRGRVGGGRVRGGRARRVGVGAARGGGRARGLRVGAGRAPGGGRAGARRPVCGAVGVAADDDACAEGEGEGEGDKALDLHGSHRSAGPLWTVCGGDDGGEPAGLASGSPHSGSRSRVLTHPM